MAKRPTKAEREHYSRVIELGCVICRMPAEIHHLLTGKGMGQKSSNYRVIPLCFFHHRGGNRGEAIHAGIKTWESKHGTEESFLRKVEEQIA
jgi:hypothetical protein